MELITKWLKKITIPIFLSVLFYISIGPKVVYAGAYDNAYDFYVTFGGGKTVKWQNDAYYFCTKASSGTGTRFATMGFKITDADGHYSNAAVNGYCIKRVGPADVEVSGYKYNLYKIDYTYLVNYMINAHGGYSNLTSVDHYNSWSRENRSPVYTFDAIMTTNASGSFGTMFENGDGTNSYNGSHYHDERAILNCGVDWSADAKSSFDNYFNITGAGANIGVDTQLLQIPDTSSPSNGLYKQSPYNYYTSYGKQFTITQTAVATYDSINFQPDMNWLHTVDVTPGHSQNWLSQYYFMYPDKEYSPYTNTLKQEEWNTGDTRVNLLGWTTYRPSNTVLTTSSVISLKYNNDSIKFQPRARIYNGASYVDTANRTDARYLLSDSVYGGVYPEGNSITVTVDGNTPTGGYSIFEQPYTNASHFVTTFDPYDSQSGVNRWDCYLSSSTDGGNTWSDWVYCFTKSGDVAENITLNAPDNQNTIYRTCCNVFDNVGNMQSVVSGWYCFDRTKPSGYFSPAGHGWNNTSFENITFTPSDTGSGVSYTYLGYAYSEDGGINWSYYTWEGGSGNFYGYGPINYPLCIDDGRQFVFRPYAYVYDKAGNVSTFIIDPIYYYDRTKPTGSSPSPGHSWKNVASENMSFTSADTGSGLSHTIACYSISFDGGNTWGSYVWHDFTGGSATYPWDIADGSSCIFIPYSWVYDKVGNGSPAIIGSKYYYDRASPNGIITPNELSGTNQSINVTFDPYDDIYGSGIKQWTYQVGVSTDGENSYSWGAVNTVLGDTTQTYTCEPIDGKIAAYMIRYTVTDNAGNTSTMQSGRYWINRIKPTIEVTPPNRPWLNTDVLATLKAKDMVESTDNLSNVYYKWDTQNKVASNYTKVTLPGSGNTINTMQNQEGTWYLWYYADDQYGNQSDIKVSGPYQIDKTAPTGVCVAESSGEEIRFQVNNIVEELSGIKDIRVVAFDKAKPSVTTQKYLVKESGTTKYSVNINLTNELLSIPIITFNIYLTDIAGNTRIYTGETNKDFTVGATIQRSIEPHDSAFLAGQEGNTIITLTNYVDKVAITFPKEFDLNGVSQNASYNLIPKGMDTIIQPFRVPFNCPAATYQVKVTGYRAGIPKTVYVPLQVQNYYTRIRTRIRSH